MLELKNVGCSVGRRELLRSVSLTLREGEIVALLGKNGSGKTTLLRAISGQQLYSGEIEWDGRPLTSFSRRERAARVGLMPQQLPCPHVPAEELVLFGRTPYMGLSGIPSPEDRRAAEDAMTAARVEQYRGRLVDTLSGGERQRCFFAMLLAQTPALLLLDEPTASLDTEYRELLYADLRAQRQAGKAVLVVLHSLPDACALADRVCVLHDGTAVFQGTPEAFADSDVPSAVFRMEVCEAVSGDGRRRKAFFPL